MPRLRGTRIGSLVGGRGMRQNALLRSAKGLGMPSTARKKDAAKVTVLASKPADDRADHFALRNGVRCAGGPLIVDLPAAGGLGRIDPLATTLRRRVGAAGGRRLRVPPRHL